MRCFCLSPKEKSNVHSGAHPFFTRLPNAPVFKPSDRGESVNRAKLPYFPLSAGKGTAMRVNSIFANSSQTHCTPLTTSSFHDPFIINVIEKSALPIWLSQEDPSTIIAYGLPILPLPFGLRSFPKKCVLLAQVVPIQIHRWQKHQSLLSNCPLIQWYVFFFTCHFHHYLRARRVLY